MSSIESLYPRPVVARVLIGGLLQRLRRDRVPAHVRAPRLVHERVCLPRNGVIAFDTRAAVSAVTVQAGTVWITTSPAQGDVILEAGGSFTIDGGLPVVVQALAPVELLVTRTAAAP